MGVMDVFTFLMVVIDSLVYTDVSKLVQVHILFFSLFYVNDTSTKLLKNDS